MNTKFSRRKLIHAAGAAALPFSVSAAADSAAASAIVSGARQNGTDIPKICLEIGPGGLAAGARTEAGARRIKQLGVDHVIAGPPGRIPWKEDQLKEWIDRLKGYGLTVGNIMISGFPNTLYGRPGRDDEIEKVIKSIRAAGKVGLPVIEYNFYAHRLIEGYYEEIGRAGAGMTAFDYDRVKDLPPLEREGTHSLEEMWANITYFLKAVVPVAEESGVRLALHPNDPPAPISRGSGQIMSTLAGWKRLLDIVKSPSNGLTFDCGVTRELGEDPIEVCRYLGARDCINHVHYRNVKSAKAVREVHRGVPRRGRQRYVPGDEGAGQAKIPAPDLPRASPRSRLRSRAAELPLDVPGWWRICGDCVQCGIHASHVAGRPVVVSRSGLSSRLRMALAGCRLVPARDPSRRDRATPWRTHGQPGANPRNNVGDEERTEVTCHRSNCVTIVAAFLVPGAVERLGIATSRSVTKPSARGCAEGAGSGSSQHGTLHPVCRSPENRGRVTADGALRRCVFLAGR